MLKLSPHREASARMDSAYGWIIVFASFWINFIIDGGVFSFAPYLNVMIVDLHVSNESAAFISSLQYGLYQISAPLVSILINWLGFRTVAFIGGCISGFGYLLASFTSSYCLTLLTLSIMVGIGSGMIYATGLLIVSFYFQKYRALATAIVLSGSSFGIMCLSLSLQALLTKWSRETTLRFQAALCLFTLVAALSFSSPRLPTTAAPYAHRPSLMSEDTEPMKKHLHTASLALQTTRMRVENEIPDARKTKKECCSLVCNYLMIHLKQTFNVSLMRSPILICLCASYFIWYLGQLTPFVFIVERSISHGIETKQAEWLLPMISVGSLIGRLVAALTSFCPSIKVIYLSSFILFIAGLLSVVAAFVLTRNFIFQAAYAVGWGALTSTAGTLGTVLFIECLGLERLTSVWGITRMFMGISVLFGAPIAATIESSTHDYAYAFLYSGLCFVLSSCVMMVIPVVLKERVRNV